VVGLWVRKSKAFAALNFNILCRPTRTGAEIILDDDPAGLLHALKYYSKTFALAFMIYFVASRFKLYEGDSEWRVLITIVVQVIIATTTIYVLCLAQIESSIYSPQSLSAVWQTTRYFIGSCAAILNSFYIATSGGPKIG
jgi:hypothetical protein